MRFESESFCRRGPRALFLCTGESGSNSDITIREVPTGAGSQFLAARLR
jgi:hypothetical protein